MEKEVDGLYVWALVGSVGVVWFTWGYVFGIHSWRAILAAVLTGFLAGLLWLGVERFPAVTRFLGVLACLAVCLLAVLALFAWEYTPSVDTTGRVIGKFSKTSGGVQGPEQTRHFVKLTFDGRTKNVNVSENMYDSLSRNDVVAVHYHMEQPVVFGHAHLVVEDIDYSGRVGVVVSGGGMKFGEPGTDPLTSWLLIIMCGIPLILMLISVVRHASPRS